MARSRVRGGTLNAHCHCVARKVALLVAALILPGGLLALAAGWLVRTLAQTEKGRKVVSLARRRVPAWLSAWAVPERAAA